MTLAYVTLATQGIISLDVDYIWSQGLFSDTVVEPPIVITGSGSSSTAKSKKKKQKPVKVFYVNDTDESETVLTSVGTEPPSLVTVSQKVQEVINTPPVVKLKPAFTEEEYRNRELEIKIEAETLLNAINLQNKILKQKRDNSNALVLLLMTI